MSVELELSEHTDAKWLSLAELNSVKWADADTALVEEIKRRLKKQTYTITKDNEDGTKETVFSKCCSEVCVMREFMRIINEQTVIYRTGELKIWRTIRVFNSKGEQVAQES